MSNLTLRQTMKALGWGVGMNPAFGLNCWGWWAPGADGGEHHRRQTWTEEEAWRDAEKAFAIKLARARDIVKTAAPEGGAVEGPGDYTMVLTEPQAFEKFPALASHIERMAVGRSVGSLIEWDAFLRELNAAPATRHEAPAEAGERDQIKRAIAYGFSNGYEQYDDASEAMRLCFDMAADAVLALRARPQAREGE